MGGLVTSLLGLRQRQAEDRLAQTGEYDEVREEKKEEDGDGDFYYEEYNECGHTRADVAMYSECGAPVPPPPPPMAQVSPILNKNRQMLVLSSEPRARRSRTRGVSPRDLELCGAGLGYLRRLRHLGSIQRGPVVGGFDLCVDKLSTRELVRQDRRALPVGLIIPRFAKWSGCRVTCAPRIGQLLPLDLPADRGFTDTARDFLEYVNDLDSLSDINLFKMFFATGGAVAGELAQLMEREAWKFKCAHTWADTRHVDWSKRWITQAFVFILTQNKLRLQELWQKRGDEASIREDVWTWARRQKLKLMGDYIVISEPGEITQSDGDHAAANDGVVATTTAAAAAAPRSRESSPERKCSDNFLPSEMCLRGDGPNTEKTTSQSVSFKAASAKSGATYEANGPREKHPPAQTTSLPRGNKTGKFRTARSPAASKVREPRPESDAKADNAVDPCIEKAVKAPPAVKQTKPAPASRKTSAAEWRATDKPEKADKPTAKVEPFRYTEVSPQTPATCTVVDETSASRSSNDRSPQPSGCCFGSKMAAGDACEFEEVTDGTRRTRSFRFCPLSRRGGATDRQTPPKCDPPRSGPGFSGAKLMTSSLRRFTCRGVVPRVRRRVIKKAKDVARSRPTCVPLAELDVAHRFTSDFYDIYDQIGVMTLRSRGDVVEVDLPTFIKVIVDKRIYTRPISDITAAAKKSAALGTQRNMKGKRRMKDQDASTDATDRQRTDHDGEEDLIEEDIACNVGAGHECVQPGSYIQEEEDIPEEIEGDVGDGSGEDGEDDIQEEIEGEVEFDGGTDAAQQLNGECYPGDSPSLTDPPQVAADRRPHDVDSILLDLPRSPCSSPSKKKKRNRRKGKSQTRESADPDEESQADDGAEENILRRFESYSKLMGFRLRELVSARHQVEEQMSVLQGATLLGYMTEAESTRVLGEADNCLQAVSRILEDCRQHLDDRQTRDVTDNLIVALQDRKRKLEAVILRTLSDAKSVRNNLTTFSRDHGLEHLQFRLTPGSGSTLRAANHDTDPTLQEDDTEDNGEDYIPENPDDDDDEASPQMDAPDSDVTYSLPDPSPPRPRSDGASRVKRAPRAGHVTAGRDRQAVAETDAEVQGFQLCVQGQYDDFSIHGVKGKKGAYYREMAPRGKVKRRHLAASDEDVTKVNARDRKTKQRK